ncbi:hypothetical protein SmJEL517_g01213 [Synchytrium microbalum]|uniref:Uncharacterized protein n=1 Tax=Synchytrium microbalum TaxID=1806994 RepID=A0A507C4T7_9FUNG|nr:uncharacterized protein SmJEL517_g01213 [Synchytrium microbalum]TPX36560.1 hypothetical protein SmJEL517_g01213 [Synchytrium microbalum]
MDIIREDVEEGAATMTSLDVSTLGSDWQTELLAIFKSIDTTTITKQTSTFLSYLKLLIPNMDATRATSEYWPELLNPILLHPESCSPNMYNDVVSCTILLLSRNKDVVNTVMDQYLQDRMRALEGKRYSETEKSRAAYLAETVPSPYWETRSNHALERVLLDWVASCSSPQEFFELIADYAVNPEHRLYVLTLLLAYFQAGQDLQLRTIIDTSLFDLLVSSAMHESHPALLSTALAALTYSLPAVAIRITNRLDRLMSVLIRVLQWEAEFNVLIQRQPEAFEQSPSSSLSNFAAIQDALPIKAGAVAMSSAWDTQRMYMNFSPGSSNAAGNSFGGRRQLGGTRRPKSTASSEAGDEYYDDDDSLSDRRKSVASSDIKLDDESTHASHYMQKLLSASTRTILKRRIDDYFTTLYGLYPCSLLRVIREWQSNPYKLTEDPFTNNFEPTQNPFAALQSSQNADTDEMDSVGSVKDRFTDLIVAHRMHQNLIFHTEESERASLARFNDLEAAEIAASCFELRSPLEASTDNMPSTPKSDDVVGIHTVYELGNALRKALRDIPHHALLSTPTSPIPIPKPTVASHPDGLRLHVLVLLSDLYLERALRSRTIHAQVQSVKKATVKEDEAEGFLNLINHIQKQNDEISDLKKKEASQREEATIIRERARKHEERLRQQLKSAKEESRSALAREKEAAAKLATTTRSVVATPSVETDTAQTIFTLENEVASMTAELTKLRESELQFDATVRRFALMESEASSQRESAREIEDLNCRIRELELQVEDSEREIEGLRKYASDASSRQQILSTHVHHLSRLVERRDKVSEEQAKIMGKSSLAAKEQLKAAEDRYATVKGINAQMEARLVDLWNQVDG